MRMGTMFGAVAALAMTTAASADVVFNNFGPGDTYTTGQGWTISDGAPINTDNDQGDAFTVTGGNFLLTSIEIALGYVTGTNRAFISLYNDDDGMPGAILETATVENMGPFGNQNDPEVALFTGTTALLEGEQYWVIASSDNNSWLAWNLNSIGDTGPHAFRANGGPWNISDGAPFEGPPGAAGTRGAFRVNGVPGPGAIALLGLAGLCGRRRRR